MSIPASLDIRTNGYGKPVVAVDIDGTLADYHSWFLNFAELYFGRSMPDPEEMNPGLPLWKFMNVSHREYRDCKLAYRQGGLKRSMPCLPGASEVLHAVRKDLGAEIWICTTRPYLRLDNVDPDTREWLDRNAIPYDALLFDPSDGDDKYKELKRQTERGERVACVVEDLPEQVMKADALDLRPVLLRDRPYNRHFEVEREVFASGGFRWDTAEQLGELIRYVVTEWKRYQ